MKILLVDDNKHFLDGLKTLLTVHGLEVAGTARDGLEAVEMARALTPDMILMDIMMPHLDGFSATRLIKTELPDVRIIMLTISHDSKDLSMAIKSGACGYLLKTDDTDVFLKQLLDLMNGENKFPSDVADIPESEPESHCPGVDPLRQPE